MIFFISVNFVLRRWKLRRKLNQTWPNSI